MQNWAENKFPGPVKTVLPGFEYAIWEEFLNRGIMLK